jgi:hypothetical protein
LLVIAARMRNNGAMDGLRLGGGVALVLAVSGSASADLNHFQCYKIRRPAPFDSAGVALLDRFGSSTITVRRPDTLCAPADKRNEDPTAPTDPEHLTSYRMRPAVPFTRVRDREIVNQLGSLRLDVIKPVRLLLPTAKSLTEPPAPPTPGIDHFQCYKVKRSRGAPAFRKVRRVQVDTQFETTIIDVLRPLHLCVPVDKNGETPGAQEHPDELLCYRTRSRGSLPTTGVQLNDQFGPQQERIRQRREFCVPSLSGSVSTTTTTSTSTSTTLPCECGTVGRLEFTTAAGTGNCGTVLNNAGSPVLDLQCGSLYLGGGGSALDLPIVVPDTATIVLNVESCSGTTVNLRNSTAAETGSDRTCTSPGCFFGAPLPIPNRFAPVLSTCVVNIVAAESTGAAVCSTGEADIDLPLTAVVRLTGDIFPADMSSMNRCIGGANDGGVCTMDAECPDGFCSIGVQPCPLCVPDSTASTGSRCHGGTNDLMPCTPGSTDLGAQFQTSHDCPPAQAVLGNLAIPFALTSGSMTDTAVDLPAQPNVFCGFCSDSGGFTSNPPVPCTSDAPCTNGDFPDCRQRNGGAFAKGSARTITETGAPGGELRDLAPHASTLVSVFCIPPTFNGAIDATTDLPSAGAVSFPGALRLHSAAP